MISAFTNFSKQSEFFEEKTTIQINKRGSLWFFEKIVKTRISFFIFRERNAFGEQVKKSNIPSMKSFWCKLSFHEISWTFGFHFSFFVKTCGEQDEDKNKTYSPYLYWNYVNVIFIVFLKWPSICHICFHKAGFFTTSLLDSKPYNPTDIKPFIYSWWANTYVYSFAVNLNGL
jgi:hypothetical protein